MSNVDEIVAVLSDLKGKNKNICACMLAKKGLEGLTVFPQPFKDDVACLWEPLSNNINDMLNIIDKYGAIGLRRSYTEMLGYGIFFSVILSSDTALIVFIKDDQPIGEAQDICRHMDAHMEKICKTLNE